MSCQDLVDQYAQAMGPAKRCAPILPVVQCTNRRELMLGCPDCSTFVQSPAQLDALKSQYATSNCGVRACPFFCQDAMSGTCTPGSDPSSGMCQDN